jgi:HPt (histidine-containing phosphotransfer) domain-containing protein
MNRTKQHPSPVDAACVERIAGEWNSHLYELVNSYLRTAAEHLEKLSVAVRAQRADDVKHVAHSCLGCSSLLGMRAIIPPLRVLEEMGTKRRLTHAVKVLAQARRALSYIEAYWQRRWSINTG